MGDDVNILYSVFKKRLSHLGIEHDETIMASQPLEEERFQFAETKALRIAMTNDVHIATERVKTFPKIVGGLIGRDDNGNLHT